jgi:hypothetical protein
MTLKSLAGGHQRDEFWTGIPDCTGHQRRGSAADVGQRPLTT